MYSEFKSDIVPDEESRQKEMHGSNANINKPVDGTEV
jgi:hypothetical protein